MWRHIDVHVAAEGWPIVGRLNQDLIGIFHDILVQYFSRLSSDKVKHLKQYLYSKL